MHELVGRTVQIGNGIERWRVTEVMTRGLLPHLVASVVNSAGQTQVHVPVAHMLVVE